jgi:hypothetical protein
MSNREKPLNGIDSGMIKLSTGKHGGIRLAKTNKGLSLGNLGWQ